MASRSAPSGGFVLAALALLLASASALRAVSGRATRRAAPASSLARMSTTAAAEAEAAGPSWVLSRKLVRNPVSLRLEEIILLEGSSSGYDVAEFRLSLPTLGGVGLELTELEGTPVIDDEGTKLVRSIVVVSSLVEGGNAWKRAGDLQAATELGSVEPGDTIVAVGDVNTEAASYDATVRAIQRMASNDEITLVVKRLVLRKVAYITAVLPSGEERSVIAYDGENLRMALIRQGVVAINDETAPRYDTKGSGNCGGNGLCCTCVVSVLSGAEHLNERTKSEKQLLRKVTRWRQSCRARILIGGAGAPVDEIKLRVQLAPRSPKPSS